MNAPELDFTALQGHTESLSALRKGGRKQPFPSLIFSGPSRIGKRLAGLWYAAYLNCFASDEASPCGQCGSCRKLLAGNHPDLLLTRVPEKKTVVGVGEIREAIHQVQYAPFEGGYRIWIVEQSERLTDEAQNALLKTLEEPPRAAVILLVTNLFGSLIPTVVSRCRLVRFQGLPHQAVHDHLASIGATPDRARALAQVSDGAVGMAVELHQNPDSLDERRAALELFLGLPGQNLWGAVETAQKLEKFKLGHRTVLEIGTSAFRDLLVLAAGSDELVNNQEGLPAMKDLSQKLPVNAIGRALGLFQEAERHLAGHVSPRLLMQNLCLGLAKSPS